MIEMDQPHTGKYGPDGIVETQSQFSAAPAPWQPIETAPRDGTLVLLWAETWEMSWGIQIGSFDDEEGYWCTAEGTVDDNDPDLPEESVEEDVNLGPTHWIPLPEPPK